MGTRSTRTMRAADLAALPDTCPVCPLQGADVDPDAAWIQAALRRYGFFGVGVFDDDVLSGYALIAPSSHVPGAHPLHRQAAPSSCVLIRTDVQCDDERGAQARFLMTTLLGRIATLPGVSAVEADGFDGRGTCVTPSLTWLESVGFRPNVQSEAPGHPMILELSRTVQLRRRVSGAGDRLRGLVPPLPKPSLGKPVPGAWMAGSEVLAPRADAYQLAAMAWRTATRSTSGASSEETAT